MLRNDYQIATIWHSLGREMFDVQIQMSVERRTDICICTSNIGLKIIERLYFKIL